MSILSHGLDRHLGNDNNIYIDTYALSGIN